MNPASNSPELQRMKKSLRRTLKPLLRYVRSQRFLNWITQLRKPASGPYYDAAVSEWTLLDGVKVLRVIPQQERHVDACMLYLHGGAYTLGSPISAEPDARRLAISCGMSVYSVKYTTAIHAPYPAAVDDAEAAYKALLAQGTAPERIVLTGTSAGGGLTLALLHRLLAQGDPLPTCSVTMSPWLDLTMCHPSIDALHREDDILSRAWLTRAAEMYAGGADRAIPELSPEFGDFRGAPPSLLLFSRAELFRDEIETFEAKLRASGVEVESAPHNHAPHAWPITAEATPESEAAFEVIAEFVGRHLTTAQ